MQALYVIQSIESKMADDDAAADDEAMVDDGGEYASSDSTSTTLYVGGLDHQVSSAVLHSVFTSFGNVMSIQLPTDEKTQQHRGFALIEFDDPFDCECAVRNMNDNELFGRTLRVHYAKAKMIVGGNSNGVTQSGAR